jgi:DNA/RNA endonuclease YhcR with UshA esterase domain
MRIYLTNLSFLILSLGILLLLFLVDSNIEYSEISEITFKNLNKYIKIKGSIKEVNEYLQYDFLLLKVEDSTGEIDVVLRNTNLNKTYLYKNMNISVIARVQQYKGKLQLNAEIVTD